MKMRFLFAFTALEIGLAVQALAPGLVNLSGDAKPLDEFIAQHERSRGIQQERCRRSGRALRG